MKPKNLAFLLLLSILVLGSLGNYLVPSASAIGVANVIVTNVYWGSDPTQPITAHPGDVNAQLSIVLSNVGDDVARGINATLHFGPPLTYNYYVNGTQVSADAVSKTAGDMEAAQGFTLTYTVSVDSDAKEGIYRYDLNIAYKSARELQQINSNVTVDVPLWKGELHIQNVVTTPTKIYPNSKQVMVKVGIVNSGRGSAKDLQLRLDLNYPFTASSSGSDIIFVGNVSPGETSEADFIIDVADTAPFGQYSVILGEEAGDRLIPIGQAPLYVNEKVRFDIVSVTPSTVRAGDAGDVIRVEIKNTGSVKAESVRAQLRVGNFFTGTLTDFLGTMLANETKVAFFTVDIDGKAQPRNYNLDLRFDWTQEENALDDTVTLVLTVEPAGFPVTLAALGVIVLIAIGGYFFMRRRRMKAPQTSEK